MINEEEKAKDDEKKEEENCTDMYPNINECLENLQTTSLIGTEQSSIILRDSLEEITPGRNSKYGTEESSLLTATEEWRKAKTLINTAISFHRRLDQTGGRRRSLSDPEIESPNQFSF